ncbi:hypothetical protein GCM10010207_45800 [Streptomyces atratus]|nr:hypothetical protein GCM10010207_45800 [Streptomyces atratus]
MVHRATAYPPTSPLAATAAAGTFAIAATFAFLSELSGPGARVFEANAACGLSVAEGVHKRLPWGVNERAPLREAPADEHRTESHARGHTRPDRHHG